MARFFNYFHRMQRPKRSFLFRALELLSLVLGLGGAVLAFISFWPSQNILRIIVFLLALFYTLWGVIAHWKSGQKNTQIWSEYAAVAFLGALMVWLVI